MKLHGVAFSNYYNLVKWGLLEKEMPFEEVLDPPSKEEAFLANSPMGKIPYLECEEGCVSESLAILVYLEKKKPHPRLFPEDAFEAARALQIQLIIDHYVDASARTLLGAAFFGKPASEEQIEKALEKTRQGLAALTRLTRFDPFIAGPEFTHADLAAGLTIPLATSIFQILRRLNLMAEIPGFTDYLARISNMPNHQKVVADQKAARDRLLASRS